jgi:hypothetical protein
MVELHKIRERMARMEPREEELLWRRVRERFKHIIVES